MPEFHFYTAPPLHCPVFLARAQERSAPVLNSAVPSLRSSRTYERAYGASGALHRLGPPRRPEQARARGEYDRSRVLQQMSSSPPPTLCSLPPTTTTTMGSSFAPSADHAFFSTLDFSSGSSTVVATRVVPVPALPQDPHASASAATIMVTAQDPSSPPSPQRESDALPKRKSTDTLARKVAKRRRVSPPTEPPSRASSRALASSRQTSRASSLLSAEGSSAPSTRATSVASAVPPPPRECWIDANGHPGPGFLSSEVVVRDLMKGYKSCESLGSHRCGFCSCVLLGLFKCVYACGVLLQRRWSLWMKMSAWFVALCGDSVAETRFRSLRARLDA